MEQSSRDFDKFAVKYSCTLSELCNVGFVSGMMSTPNVRDFDDFIMENFAVVNKLCDGDYGSDSDSDYRKQPQMFAKSKVPTKAKTVKRMKKNSKITSTATAFSGELVDSDDE